MIRHVNVTPGCASSALVTGQAIFLGLAPCAPGGKLAQKHWMILVISTSTLWLFNIAMENGPFLVDFPIEPSIYKGFSMAMLNNQMVRNTEMLNQHKYMERSTIFDSYFDITRGYHFWYHLSVHDFPAKTAVFLSILTMLTSMLNIDLFVIQNGSNCILQHILLLENQHQLLAIKCALNHFKTMS